VGSFVMGLLNGDVDVILDGDVDGLSVGMKSFDANSLDMVAGVVVDVVRVSSSKSRLSPGMDMGNENGGFVKRIIV